MLTDQGSPRSNTYNRLPASGGLTVKPVALHNEDAYAKRRASGARRGDGLNIPSQPTKVIHQKLPEAGGVPTGRGRVMERAILGGLSLPASEWPGR